MKMKKYISLFLLLFLLSSCYTSKSSKQIDIVDKNVVTIQEKVKEAKSIVNKTKKTITEVKKEQPNCNLDEVNKKVEILDFQITSIDNSLLNLKQQVGISKYIADVELEEYIVKYHKCVIYLMISTALLVFIIFDAVNITKISNWVKILFSFIHKNKK